MRLSACGTLGLLPSPGAKRRGEGLGVGGCFKGRRSERAPTPNPSPQREDALGEGNTPSGVGKPSAAHERASSTNDT
jgi:hypothetical protein